ncbi:PIN2/TERF1-interacting telomerase inhibitor 1-like [Salarias fasciatus]|uniref:PIN2/TERF1-interacting telomerase inhibitor 1-like n=1 Tax=Salarias fasciatus TaxID=181472 RepID=UPI0011766858|nr:PIN2/TERF1-interacting telomerase inhibitor 1-like [Salarias fasciatus]
MSMLAEPRRKQKWSVDPRNSAWSNDDSKFGQKMLERMGWSKGKGLGRTEQGSTDHIKVKVKNDSYGLGANASHEDKWIAHQDDFNELLAQLNNCHGQNSNGTPPEEPRGFSLEEKSKTSRKRVHYMKFTKGKDLSSRSETDLNCIFGKRAKPPKEQEQESNSGDSSQGETEENAAAAPSELDPESITNTVTSTLTMQEYFAQRMARLKNGRGAQSAAASEETSPARDDTEEPEKKKKKKKKNKKSSEEVMSNPVIVIEDEQNHEPSKKKRKTAKDDHAVTENCEDPSSTRKKKLKKLHLEDELQNGLDQTETQITESEVTQKKKKKKHREEGGEGVDSVATEDRDEPVQKKPKKKKKKRE